MKTAAWFWILVLTVVGLCGFGGSARADADADYREASRMGGFPTTNATLAAGKLLIGGPGNVAIPVAQTGDASMSTTGVFTVTAASGAFAVTGATTLTGALTANGNTTLGNATTDVVRLVGVMDGSSGFTNGLVAGQLYTSNGVVRIW